MRNTIILNYAAFIAAMMLSTMASAATPAKQSGDGIGFSWSAKTGLGYDSNTYRAPSSNYVDYAALPTGLNPTVVSKEKAGFFVPYEIKVDAAKSRDSDNTLIGSGGLDGNLYLGSGLGNANQYNIDLAGGLEHVLQREGKAKNTFYAGGMFGKHKQVYVDHDTGLGHTTTAGNDVSDRYSYYTLGVEAEYKHRIGSFDYGFNGKFALNDYDVISGTQTQEDHTYIVLGTDASLPIAKLTRLKLSLVHKIRTYSKRHSRNSQGTLSVANPLLRYTYDSAGITVRSRLTNQWLVYGDFDYRQRVDGNVGYNNYNQNRMGLRLLFEQGKLKTRFALHHWERDYPNGFAFDEPIGGAKTYSGNDLKFKAELGQTNNSALWVELVYDTQTSTDLRYDYVRTLIMTGMSWAY